MSSRSSFSLMFSKSSLAQTIFSMYSSTSSWVRLQTESRSWLDSLPKRWLYWIEITSVFLKHLVMRSYITPFLFGRWMWQWFLMPFEIAAISRASSNLVRSMLAPLRMQTTFFPLISCRILLRPAMESAPEGSQMKPKEYTWIIISANFFSLTSTNPSTEVRPMLKAISEVVFTDEPLQNLLTFQASISLPARMEEEYGLQLSGSTPMTLVLGLICLTTLAMELTNPPPPVGTTIQSICIFLSASRISLPIVANPCRSVGVSYDLRMGRLCYCAYLIASSVHSSKSIPRWMISTNFLPSLRMTASLC